MEKRVVRGLCQAQSLQAFAMLGRDRRHGLGCFKMPVAMMGLTTMIFFIIRQLCAQSIFDRIASHRVLYIPHILHPVIVLKPQIPPRVSSSFIRGGTVAANFNNRPQKC